MLVRELWRRFRSDEHRSISRNDKFEPGHRRVPATKATKVARRVLVTTLVAKAPTAECPRPVAGPVGRVPLGQTPAERTAAATAAGAATLAAGAPRTLAAVLRTPA